MTREKVTQEKLKELGFYRGAIDGEIGPKSKAACVEYCLSTFGGIEKPNIIKPKLQLSPESIKLIIYSEVTSKAHYNAKLVTPTWPGGASGVTIGVGYDLGYSTLTPWTDKLDPKVVKRLSVALGKTGTRAMRLISSLRDIVIPYDTALSVFKDYTIPAEIDKTARAFPGLELLHPHIQGALVSLVFNRGTLMSGHTRSEMREVRDCVKVGDIKGIAMAIRNMKRLWGGPDERGLLIRRDAEADLVIASLNKTEVDDIGQA